MKATLQVQSLYPSFTLVLLYPFHHMIQHKNILLPPACSSQNKTKVLSRSWPGRYRHQLQLLATDYTVCTVPYYSMSRTISFHLQESWQSACYGHTDKKAVMWSWKYFFRLRHHRAANPNCGSGPGSGYFYKISWKLPFHSISPYLHGFMHVLP